MSEIGITAAHPSEFIAEELIARGWSADDLAQRMSDGTARDFGVCRLSLDFYDQIGPDNACMRIGAETAGRLAKAFSVSAEFFLNLEADWLRTLSTQDTPDMRATNKGEG